MGRHRLRLANETLQEAEVLLEASRWRGAANRLYYAAFYAARALLALRDLDSARHSDVIALFQRQFVKTNIIPADVARTLPRAFESRQTSDYADTVAVDERSVRQLKTEVASFVAACERALEYLSTETSGVEDAP